jgi:hypothetical protein
MDKSSPHERSDMRGRAPAGAWHGGGAGNSGRSRGFQLWLALPADQELEPSESIYQKPQDVPAKGPAAVLLGALGEVSSPLKAPSFKPNTAGIRHGEAPLPNAVRGKILETDGPLGRKRRWHRSRNSECDEVCADLDLVCKCAMDWALLCNLDQLLALRFV